ncbi:MAG: recombinase family protein [Bdellovibrionaceae bacterium]|nr:recombinase family protein [Pseudobdellovibrionaceae bacterium]
MDEIAALTVSSKKTVRRYLLHFGIPLRPQDEVRPLKQERFGMRRVNGALVVNKAEATTLARMHALRNQGRSIREIVDILNDLKIPTRKRGAKWHVKTVFQCLKLVSMPNSTNA